MDLHSGRSTVDFDLLARLLGEAGAEAELIDGARGANTANEVLGLAQAAGLPLADSVARLARQAARSMLGGTDIAVAVLVVDRGGQVVGRDG